LGTTKFDDTTWTVYTTSNSGLPDNRIGAITADGTGYVWIGTGGGGLAKFDGVTWAVYNTSNSGLPFDHVFSLAFDENGTLWIGTGAGLARYDGTDWTVYNTSNSGLPSNGVFALAIDGIGNKWIGTEVGVSVFQEGGVVSIREDPLAAIVGGFRLSQNYPNPFNPSTRIEYALSSQQFVTLKIYDLLGREVATLVNEEKQAGDHQVVFDASRLSSGVYMYRLTAGSFSASNKMIVMK